LEDVTILDLTRLLPGGYCTLLLGDLGADVIKVEEPGRGDYIRWTAPMVDGESASHMALNRGKRSITLNLKTSEGVGLLHRLAGSADALIESFRPGVMDRLGVGFEALRENHARLIYCAITGFGQDGPYARVVGHDLNYIGYGGVLSMTGSREGPPAIPGVQIGDLGAGGMMAAVGILAALHDRATTGQGRFVDVSMLDGVVSWLSVHAAAYLATGEIPRAGDERLSGRYACYRVYRAGDGRYVTVGALEPQFWSALCTTLDCPDLIPNQYGPDQEEMAARLQDVFATKSRDEWVHVFEGIDACVGPVNDVAEALSDPQILARGMIAEIEGKRIGPASALKFGEQRGVQRAPGLGEHTAEVLAGIGVREDELAGLRARGVV